MKRTGYAVIASIYQVKIGCLFEKGGGDGGGKE